ncbi:MAG TPA: sensor histidine kinase, partial [Burkholderiaceae bacterium]|nr:sensor histidine kinase [Burkholderiaceae bacterium]
VDRLLTLSRADAGSVSLKRVSTELRGLVAEVVDWMRPLADERHQTLQVSAGKEYTAMIDRALTAQAVLDLLDNAIRYSPEATTIDIEVVATIRGAEIRISDRGPGLPSDQCEAAFERFWRADSARARDGVGLGLSIVRALARAQGGDAWLAPRPGGGLTATIIVPLAT